MEVGLIPSSENIFAAGPLIALPPIIGETATVNFSLIACVKPVKLRIGSILSQGFEGK